MKLAVLSDIHGTLPSINSCDVVCICGDIVPLSKQSDMNASEIWIKNDFFSWVSNLECQRVLFIGGNHDYIFEYLGSGKLNRLIYDAGLEFKLIYLNDNFYIYNDITFYGCPKVQNLYGWAFFTPDPKKDYDKIPNCTVLLTHQPPKVGDISRSLISLQDWGSIQLRDVIENRDIKYMFCGHVHDGDHRELVYHNTYIQNVSLKNDDYILVYPITYININKDGYIQEGTSNSG